MRIDYRCAGKRKEPRTCVEPDCGKEFMAGANNTNQVRCPECQKKRNKENWREQDYYQNGEKRYIPERDKHGRVIEGRMRTYFFGYDPALLTDPFWQEEAELLKGTYLSHAEIKAHVENGDYFDGYLFKKDDQILIAKNKELVPA